MTNFIENGYFHWEIDTDSAVAETIIIFILSLSIIIQCIIAFSVMRNFRQNENIGVVAYLCFMMSFVTAFVTVSSDIVRHVWDPPHWETVVGHTTVIFINLLSLGLFYGSVLLTYIVRLYTTFKDSTFKMKSSLIMMFIVILVLYIVFLIAFDVLRTFDLWIDSNNPTYVCLRIFFCSLYLIGCVLAVYFFVSNLLKTAKETVNSLRDVNNAKEIELGHVQQKLSDLSAKYSLLFGMAVFSTIAFFFISWSFAAESALREPILSLDLCVNLWCTYLQFHFARDHYERWCGRCDRRCRKHGRKRTRTLIYNRSMDLAAMTQCITQSAQSNIAVDIDKEDEA